MMQPDMEIAIERACTRLVLRSVDFIDRAEFEEFAALFAEDAVLDLGPRVMRGPAEIRSTLSKRSPAVVMSHVITNILITPTSAKSATGSSYLTYFRCEDGTDKEALSKVAPNIIGCGVYQDRYVETPEGWRIAHRQLRFRFGG